MKRIVVAGASAVFLGAGVLLAPSAAADPPIEQCGQYFCPCPDVFRLPTELDAWTSWHPVLFNSPYGRSNIYCHFSPQNGYLDAWQQGSDGYHQLYNVQNLSSAGMGKLYVWNADAPRERP